MIRKPKSPLRYPGGKTRAIKQILPRIINSSIISDFREPFVGGGSVFFAVKNLLQNRLTYWINDINYDLYCFWKMAKNDNENFVNSVIEYKENYLDGRELFHYLRDKENLVTESDYAVRFFILNRITFSGTVDSGGYSKGAFEKRFTHSSIERLRNIEQVLQRVRITNNDYSESLQTHGENVFLFLDPPYWSTTSSRLYGKKGDLHKDFDHKRFAEDMRKCNHRWLITYDDSEYIRELFSFATIEEWTLQYGMNNYKQESSAKGDELFIYNY